MSPHDWRESEAKGNMAGASSEDLCDGME